MTDVLQEYLISLGFKLDDAGWERFNARLNVAGKRVIDLGAVTVAAATQIGIAVEKTARVYEELYYVSQRTGSSVSALKAYEFGAKQIGLTSEQARSSVESLATSIRMNPGVAGLVRGMGLDPNDPQKAILGITDRLRKQYGPSGYFVAARQAQGLFGIDEGTFRQLWMNLDRLKSEEAAHIDRQKETGVNADDAAIKFRDFATNLNTTADKFSLIKDRIALDFLPAATATLGVVNNLITLFNQANNATDGWTGRILAVVSALSLARIGITAVMSLLGLGGVTSAAGAVGTRLLGAAAIGAGGLGLPLAAVGGAAWLGHSLAGGPNMYGATSGPYSTRSKDGLRDEAVKYFMQMGWSREQALGIAANLMSESSLNHLSTGDGGKAYGIAQWHPDRQAAFKAWSGKDIRQSSLQEQLAFVNYELTQGGEQRAGRMLKGAGSARDAAAIVSQNYERPANAMGEAMKRGALADSWAGTVLTSGGSNGNVTISPTVTNHIYGQSDPNKTADLVGKENDRMTGNLTRWGAGAIDNGAPVTP